MAGTGLWERLGCGAAWGCERVISVTLWCTSLMVSRGKIVLALLSSYWSWVKVSV